MKNVLRFLAFAMVLGCARAAGGPPLPPAAGVAVTYQPLNQQLEAFTVDANGALNVVWKENNGSWKEPVALTQAGFATPGASVAAVYYPSYQQLEVFVVDRRGVLNVVWKEKNQNWQGPVGLTVPGFAQPGAHLTAVYQSVNEQLEVFTIAADGALNVIWKEQNGNWKTPFPLTRPEFAAPGAHIAGVYYPPYEQLEVFLVDKGGVINVIWKEHNGGWKAPVGISPLGFVAHGAPLTAIYQPLNQQLEVLTVDNRGAISVIWKKQNKTWQVPTGLTDADSVKRGSVLASVYYPPNEQLEVLFVDKRGVFNVLWKEHNSAWKGPVGVTSPEFVPGAAVSAVFYPQHDQLEAFSVDGDGILKVEWKVRNQAWVPCPIPLIGTSPQRSVPLNVWVPTVMGTERVGQLTGSPDPANLPSLNATSQGEWKGAGILGTDLGANTDHQGKLFIFFGDVVPGNPGGSPARDTDLVAWTQDTALRAGGFALHPIKGRQFFDPFSVDSGIGILPIDRTPTGAFSYGTKAYVFGLWDDPRDPFNPNTQARSPTAILASKADPAQAGPYHLEFILSKRRFWQVAPVVVKNAEHPGMPESQGDGLVLLGGGLGEGNDAIHLAWMRLEPGCGPVPHSIRYYTGNPQQPWTPAEQDLARALAHEDEAKAVLPLAPHYTSVSANWLPGPRQWVVVYSKATNDMKTGKVNPAGPVVARFGASPWVWSHEVELFNTCRDQAYGRYMHWSGVDNIPERVPPAVSGDAAGWAYGAFLMQRFGGWDVRTHQLTLAYLMSTSNPYQVQVMRTRVRLPAAWSEPRK